MENLNGTKSNAGTAINDFTFRIINDIEQYVLKITFDEAERMGFYISKKTNNSLFISVMTYEDFLSKDKFFLSFDNCKEIFKYIQNKLKNGLFCLIEDLNIIYLKFTINLETKMKDFSINVIKDSLQSENELVKLLNQIIFDISIPNCKLVSFKSSTLYIHPSFESRLNYINDLTTKNGITLEKIKNQNSYICFELNSIFKIEGILIQGFMGGQGWNAAAGGKGALIHTSKDNISWHEVGVIPENFGEGIIFVKLKSTEGQFLKFTKFNDLIGIGYLKIITDL